MNKDRKNRILAVVGMPGSGKTESVNYIQTKNYLNVYFGKPVFDELKKRGLKLTPQNEKLVREDLRNIHGMGAMAILCGNKLDQVFKKGDVVIESFYSWDEYKIVKNKYGDNFKVLAIYAPPNVRHSRLISRKNEKKNDQLRKFNIKEAIERDRHELENLAKGGPIAMADYTIINTGSMDNLHKNIDKILNKQ